MLLSSSNRKYPPFPLSNFSVVVYLRCLLHHILSFIVYTFWENLLALVMMIMVLTVMVIFCDGDKRRFTEKNMNLYYVIDSHPVFDYCNPYIIRQTVSTQLTHYGTIAGMLVDVKRSFAKI